jgi:hypothetical protein
MKACADLETRGDRGQSRPLDEFRRLANGGPSFEMGTESKTGRVAVPN